MKSLLFAASGLLLTTFPIHAEDRDRSTQVLTKEMREKLSPDEILSRLKAGNNRFAQDKSINRDVTKHVRQSVAGQYPKAIVLSCVDSRVPVETVFDQGIGDLFVARVAGNFVNTDILGSMEFATKVAGSKLIIVMGHEHCGAVKSAVDDVKLGNITSMLSKIKPAVAAAGSKYKGEKTSKNAEFVHQVCKENIVYNIDRIMKESKVIGELVKKGKVKVVGAIYDMDTGKVSFMEPNYPFRG